jgi:hypothetical protein
MKRITEYLASNTNIDFDKSTKKILQYFGIGKIYDKYQDVYDCVFDWCKKNLVKDNKIFPMCDQETYNEFENIGNAKEFDKVKFDFNTSYTGNEICQEELDKVKDENKIEIDHNVIDIYYTENMIACISMIGTIYCWTRDVM